MAGKVWLVSRHQGTLDWFGQYGVLVDGRVAHLEPHQVSPGDTVIGNLPTQLVAQLNQRGVTYQQFCLDIPEALRGQELSCEQVSLCNPRLQTVVVTPQTAQSAEAQPESPQPDALAKAGGRVQRWGRRFFSWCGNRRKYIVTSLLLVAASLGASWLLHDSGRDNALVDVLDRAGIVMGWFFFITTWPVAIYDWWLRNRNQPLEIQNLAMFELSQQYDAGMMLIGTNKRNVTPDWFLNQLSVYKGQMTLGFICSKNNDSLINASRLYKAYSDNTYSVAPDHISDNARLTAFDFNQDYKTVRRQLERFIEDLEVNPSRTFIEVTGGTALMTGAAILAARELGVSIIYIQSAENDGSPLERTDISNYKAARIIHLDG
ncbi:MAG: CRISPR-associated protein Csx16 [Marinobacterium sp.]|nr:CRISPR-associated protein Csx16 [Marinobacterium sp.]